MSKEIKALEAEVDRLAAELQDARQRLYDVKVAASGISVGDIVMDKRGVLHRVTYIDVSWAQNPPWVKGNPQKKDGTWGIVERNLYHYWTKED
jgi:hypothetical protein